MALSNGVVDLLWKELFHADMRTRIFLERSQTYRLLETFFTGLAAVCGSLAFVGTISELLGKSLLPFVTLVSALSTIYLSIAKPGDKARLAASLAALNASNLGECEKLWAIQNQLTDNEIIEKIAELSNARNSLEQEAVRVLHMPSRKIEIAFNETIRARPGGLL